MARDASRISRTPFWKKGVVMLAAGWIVIWISRMMLTPIYPVLSRFFGGASSTQLGMISSFYFLGYVLMQIPSGLLVDRLGLKTIVVPGFIIFSLLIATSQSRKALMRIAKSSNGWVGFSKPRHGIEPNGDCKMDHFWHEIKESRPNGFLYRLACYFPWSQ